MSFFTFFLEVRHFGKNQYIKKILRSVIAILIYFQKNFRFMS